VAVTGVGLAVVLPFVAALRWDGYSHRSQYLSELGAREAPDGAVVSVGFLAVGVLFVAWAVVAAPRVAAAAGAIGAATAVAVWLAGGGLGASYAVSAVARCEPGCPDERVGTAQAAHNLVSSAGYTLAVVALIVFGLAVRRSGRAPARRVGRAGLVAAPVLAAIGLAVPVAGDWRGLLQRLLDAGLYAWTLAVAHIAAAATPEPDDGPPIVAGTPAGEGAGRPGPPA
jgi:hypothetical protein